MKFLISRSKEIPNQPHWSRSWSLSHNLLVSLILDLPSLRISGSFLSISLGQISPFRDLSSHEHPSTVLGLQQIWVLGSIFLLTGATINQIWVVRHRQRWWYATPWNQQRGCMKRVRREHGYRTEKERSRWLGDENIVAEERIQELGLSTNGSECHGHYCRERESRAWFDECVIQMN